MTCHVSISALARLHLRNDRLGLTRACIPGGVYLFKGLPWSSASRLSYIRKVPSAVDEFCLLCSNDVCIGQGSLRCFELLRGSYISDSVVVGSEDRIRVA